MFVTQHACHVALYRLLKQLKVVETGNQIRLERLNFEWRQSSGLRQADLDRSLGELGLRGEISRLERNDGSEVIQVTEAGLLAIERSTRLLGDFSWTTPIHSLLLELNTASILRRARRRYRMRRTKASSIDARSEERRKSA